LKEEEESKALDNEIMMRKCLFGWIRLIYEAINLFISVHNSDGVKRKRRRKRGMAKVEKTTKKQEKFRRGEREIWALGMLCQRYRSVEIRTSENTAEKI
jgi:hypothetical protein